MRRDRLLLTGSLAGICALAWLYLHWMARAMYAESCPMHAAATWTGGYFAMTFGMWAIMMMAMMLPSASPMILTVGAITRKRGGSPWLPYVFTAGYLAAWAGFSIAATSFQWGLQAMGVLSSTTLRVTPAVGGLLLVAAGFYQCTRLKSACLARCNPLAFLMYGWREGSAGALIMGLHHGLFCIGCCAVLMLLLFVAGAMNLLWIALIGAVVLIEKILPPRRALNYGLAGASAAVGAALAIEGFVRG
jgi:predicted metal-binding membrane protein